MPYDSIAALPDSVKSALPRGAQQIYLGAFNGAWKEYSEAKDREARAHKVAWATVKKKYQKVDGEWVKQ